MTWVAAAGTGTGRPWGAALGLALGLLCACDGADAEPVDPPTPFPDPAPFIYPSELWDAGIEGTAILMVHVNERGAVDSVYVHESSRFPEFDSAAVRGAHALRFSPARQGQRRVGLWTRLPVRFALDSLALGLTAPTPPSQP